MDDDSLARAITVHGRDAYLLTVGDEGPHTSFVTVRYDAGRLSCILGKNALANVERTPDVSVFWPPLEDGGYGIIVNGRVVHEEAHSAPVEIRITKAVLHRAGEKPDGSDGPCPSDCRPLRLT